MTTVELDRFPGTGALYRRAAAGLLPGRRPPDAPPDTGLLLRGVTVDRTRLAGYARVCGFRLTDRLPATYPHVLGFPLALRLMTDPGFPFPAVGVVHIANRIELRRPLTADDTFDLSVRAEGLREHRRGRQIDLVTEASVAGEPVWREVSTYLHRSRRGGTGDRPAGPGGDDRPGGPGGEDRPGEAGGGDRPEPTTVGEPSVPGEPSAVWRVEPAVAREYARISGDRNPIHTSALAARAFGFRRRIAHGMWTHARCLAQLAPRLPDAYRVEVVFRAPVLLPATVGFTAGERSDGWEFGVRDPRSGKPHLAGRLTAGAAD